MNENNKLQHSLLREAMRLHEKQKPQLLPGFEDDIMQHIAPKHRHHLVPLYSAIAAVAAVAVIAIMIIPRMSTNNNDMASVDTLEYSQPLTEHHDEGNAPQTATIEEKNVKKDTGETLATASTVKRMTKARHTEDSSMFKRLYTAEKKEKSEALGTETSYPTDDNAENYPVVASTLPDQQTMFIEASYDHSALSTNRDRMVQEMGLELTY